MFIQKNNLWFWHLQDLPKLPEIEELILDDNVIESLESLKGLAGTPLRRLSLQRNPVCFTHKYRQLWVTHYLHILVLSNNCVPHTQVHRARNSICVPHTLIHPARSNILVSHTQIHTAVCSICVPNTQVHTARSSICVPHTQVHTARSNTCLPHTSVQLWVTFVSHSSTYCLCASY